MATEKSALYCSKKLKLFLPPWILLDTGFNVKAQNKNDGTIPPITITKPPKTK